MKYQLLRLKIGVCSDTVMILVVLKNFFQEMDAKIIEQCYVMGVFSKKKKHYSIIYHTIQFIACRII